MDMEAINDFIDWTNLNSGFLSVILFGATVIYGWLSGLFGSLIKKPKLKIRFIDKLSFFSMYLTGENWKHPDSKLEYELHKTGFVAYMSFANVGNMATSIDKIYIGYYLNKPGFFKKINWLAQWHTIEPFLIPIIDDKYIYVKALRTRSHQFDDSNKDYIDVGASVIGVSYFEQQTAYGNFSPLMNKDNTTTVTIKILDVYGKKYLFKTKLRSIDIADARTYNRNFGNIESHLK